MRKRQIWNCIVIIPLLVWALIILYPILWTVLGSFKDNQELYSNPWGIAKVWHPENYLKAWTEAEIGSYFFNSVLVTAFSVFFGIFLSALAAYIVDRFQNWATKLIFALFTVSMMLPVVLSLVPKFLIIKSAGLINTRLSLILIYVASGIPFGVFTLRTYFSSLPKDFEESAYLDGAGYFTIFFRIVAPLVSAGMSVVAVFLFLRSWNEVYHAMIMLTDTSKYTIPVGMIRLIEVQQYSVEYGPILAGVVIAIIPILIFFLLAQKKLVAGITAGGLKG